MSTRIEREKSRAVRVAVETKYAEAARRAARGENAACCGPSCGCGGDEIDPVSGDLYDSETLSRLPSAAVAASLGCGNPTALAELTSGEVVLDLGSGGGIDVLLAAARVGPEGRVYGLDATDEMIELSERNAAAAGVENVEFLKGDIERIPLPDDSVDVIISNCVVNLATDKRKVLQEAHRVLRPGGRFAVSDVVVRGYLTDEVRRSLELWVGCIAGALEESEFERLLLEVGFVEPSLETTRVYDPSDARGLLSEAGLEAEDTVRNVEGRLVAAFVRAVKPEAGEHGAVSPESSEDPACCASHCCGGGHEGGDHEDGP